MTEINKYIALKEKLQGVCDENNLVYGIQNARYPFRMTIRPTSGMDAQLDMLESLGDSSDAGYISPDAALVFAYLDGDLVCKTSKQWTISETLFNKLKNIFKKLHALWTQYYFRSISALDGSAPLLREVSGGPGADPEGAEDDFPEELVDPYSEFVADEADDDRPASGLYDED